MATEDFSEQQARKKDFFINYAPQDVAWAEWIAWQLEKSDYTVILPPWDFLAGSNMILELNKAVTDTERTIAVFTPHYMNALRILPDWTVTYKRDMASEQKLLIPIRVLPCEAEGILSVIKPIDIVGHDENTARQLLLEGIKKERAKSVRPPKFPGCKPQIFGIELENNPLFVGREHTIKVLYNTLDKGSIAIVTHALDSSKGSVGKTEVAREYVYRYQYEYSTVIWVQDNPLDNSFRILMKSLQNIIHQLNVRVKDTTDLVSLLTSLRGWIEEHADWLLVLDGIKRQETLLGLIPEPLRGHILVTTRERALAAIAPLIELKDRTPEELELSDKLSKLIDAALRSSDGTQIHIGPGDTTIGSASNNIHVIKHPSVSPYHAVIFSKDSNYYITDLEGSTGTFVNDLRLIPGVPVLLKRGDSIKIGDVLWAYGPGAPEVTFANNNTSAEASRNTSLSVVPRIEEPLEIVKRARQDPPPTDWQIFFSEKTSFPDFRRLILNLRVTYIRALFLLMFLVTGGVLTLWAMAVDWGVGSFLFYLFIICVSVLAIGYVAFSTADTIGQTPEEPVAPPYQDAILVLTPAGFVEYIDEQEAIDCVSYADVALMQVYQDEVNHADWLDILYHNGEGGQWSPRANFRSPRYVTQQILEAYTCYNRKYYMR